MFWNYKWDNVTRGWFRGDKVERPIGAMPDLVMMPRAWPCSENYGWKKPAHTGGGRLGLSTSMSSAYNFVPLKTRSGGQSLGGFLDRKEGLGVHLTWLGPGSLHFVPHGLSEALLPGHLNKNWQRAQHPAFPRTTVLKRELLRMGREFALFPSSPMMLALFLGAQFEHRCPGPC